MLLAGTLSAASVLADTPSTGPEDKQASSEKVAADSSKATVRAGSSTAKGTARGGATSSSAVAAQRVALTTGLTSTHSTLKPDLSALSKPADPSATIVEEPPTARALRLITACQSRFESVTDYTCTFYKRERINGRLTPLYVMAMKARTKPKSIYFKFADPYKGREAIFVEGQNGGKILAHDVGFTKFLAGTLELEPSSSRAMEDNRHPITEAGIGALIDTVARRWAAELSSDESVIVFDSDMTIGPRHCQLIEVDSHPPPAGLPVLQGAAIHRLGTELADPLRRLRLAQGTRCSRRPGRGILVHRPQTQRRPRRHRFRCLQSPVFLRSFLIARCSYRSFPFGSFVGPSSLSPAHSLLLPQSSRFVRAVPIHGERRKRSARPVVSDRRP